MLKFLCLLFVLYWIPLLTHADNGRYQVNFGSRNGQYELRLLPTVPALYSTSWGVFRKATGQQLYPVTGSFASKTVYVANDGQALAVVDDYSEAKATDSVEVLSFYRAGRKVRGYRLNELLCSAYNISSSASHFTWYANSRFQAATQQLTLTTYELTTLTFQIESGALVSHLLSPLVTPTTLLVYGKVKSVGPHRYDLQVCHRVYGRVPADGHIQFTSKAPLWNYVTVLIENGQQVGTPTLTERWILNQCAYELELASRNEPSSRVVLNGRRLTTCP